MNNKKLFNYREQINKIDLKLISLLSDRNKLTTDIAHYKVTNKYPIRDIEREQDLLNNLIIESKKLNIDSFYITKIFKLIIENSILTQQAILQLKYNYKIYSNQAKIAFLGPKGSYSYLATLKYSANYFNKLIEYNCEKFSEVVHVTSIGKVNYGILPIENTISGIINDVYDLLWGSDLFIVGEIFLPINHCILSKYNNINLNEVKTICSHAQPFQQCSKFLSCFPNLKLKNCTSTAEAMKKVAESDKNDIVALGSQEGGLSYGLRVIANNVSNQQNNITRFIVLSNKLINVSNDLPVKTSMVFLINDNYNIILNILLIFKEYDISLICLKSKYIIDIEVEKLFYFIDLDINIHDLKFQQALKKIKNTNNTFKILGCFLKEKNIFL